MMSRFLIASLLLSTSLSLLHSQNTPTVTSVTNAIDGSTRLAPGSLANVTGTGMPTPTTASVSVGGKTCAVLSGSPTQLRIQIAVDGPTGAPAGLVVGASAPFNVNLIPYAPTLIPVGTPGLPTPVHRASGGPIAPNSPAGPNESIVLFAIGLGPTNPPVPTGTVVQPNQPAVTTQTPVVTVGGVGVQVQSSSLAAGQAGIYQVTITMPANLPPNTNQLQVVLSIAGSAGPAISLPVGGGGPPVSQGPSIRPNSVVNAASYIQPGLPSYGIAQGGMFILKGQGLGARGILTATAFPLGNTMGSPATSMTIAVAGTTVNVLMIYVVAGQPNLGDEQGPYDQLAGIVPSTSPTGSGTVRVTFNGQTSAPVPITIVKSAFGVFTINQGGTGPGVFTDPNFSVNTLVTAAHPGDLLFIWGTGLGPIGGSDAGAPPVGNLDVPVEVYVGNVKANVTYQGRSGCCAGIDQILFTVPQGVVGCYVSVVVKIGNVVSNFVTVSIAAAGSVCSDPAGFTTAELQKAQSGAAMSVATLGVFRLTPKITIPGTGTLQGNLDFAGDLRFQRYQPGGVLASSLGSLGGSPGLPSSGCVTGPSRARGKFFDDSLSGSSDPVPAQGLDAGPALNINGPQGSRRVPRTGSAQEGGFEYALDEPPVLGGGLPPFLPSSPDYLTPGNFTIDNGSGGPDVGNFSATLTIPSTTITWTNQDSITNISRSQDLTVTWNGGSGLPMVVILGSSANPAASAGAKFTCVAPAAAGSFTVPSWVLSVLPPSGNAPDVNIPDASLAIATAIAAPARFTARGIDAGYFNWAQLQFKNVNYQ